MTECLEEARTARLRSQVYGFLGRVVLKEVDEPLLNWCREQEEAGLWGSLGVPLGKTPEKGAIEELAVDYCRLFVLSGQFGSPHESVQRSKAGEQPLLNGDPASAAKRFYREAGYPLSEEAGLLPDSLGAQLGFMETLCLEEARLADVGRADDARRLRGFQKRMLAGHIALWVPAYARKMAAQARTAFYRTMLELLADFVESEALEEREREF